MELVQPRVVHAHIQHRAGINNEDLVGGRAPVLALQVGTGRVVQKIVVLRLELGVVADVKCQPAALAHRPIQTAQLIAVIVIGGRGVSVIRIPGRSSGNVGLRIKLQIRQSYRVEQLLRDFVAWCATGLCSET